ncbi:MAG: hypothetical protein WDZ77_02250 [Candidatus Pacearchaeota archaeon]
MLELGQILGDVALTFSFSEALLISKPLLLFIFGMGIYSIFIFKFYRFVSKREIFEFDFFGSEKIEKGTCTKSIHFVGYILKYLVFFPILTFFWVIVLTIIIAFLSRSGEISNILLVSMALVGVIRIMAYYDEDLSKDLSKMLPFALLGVFLVDISYFSIQESIATISKLPELWKVGIYYLFFIVILEFIFRLWNLLFVPKD